jgi:hypothetical protein
VTESAPHLTSAMSPAISVRDFYLVVSMSDFVTWFGDGDGEFSANEALKSVLNALGIAVDLRALYVTYFEQTPIGTGDVFVYRTNKESKRLFALSHYRELTDQMDLVSFAVSCDEHCLSVVRGWLRTFFDGASCQVHYEEASYSSDLRRMIDQKSYPAIIEESGYMQSRHEIYG